jgi:hypothetical protein
MTQNPLNLTSGSASFNFTSPSAAVYGTNAMFDWMGMGVMTLWAGDSDNNGTVEYNTTQSDQDPITLAVYLDPGNINFESFYVVNNVYEKADTDLTGSIEYNTTDSDVDAITISVYLHPGNTGFESFFVVNEQIP